MSISAGTVWEVRAAGSDTNGGLFYAAQAGAGTDYSRQDAAQLSLTDAVTNGTTTVTSATGGFTAAMIGNGINIAGTCYMIATRSSTNTITVDRVIGAASGQTGKVGGALGSPGYCASQLSSASDQVWVKAGTYMVTTASTNAAGGCVSSPGGTAGFPCKWEGYQATRGDKGTKPLLDAGSIGGSPVVFDTAASYVIVDNIHCASPYVSLDLSQSYCRAIRCKTSGARFGVYLNAAFVSAICCEAANSGSDPGFSVNGEAWVFGCTAHGGGGDGFKVNALGAVFSDCIAFGNGGAGFNCATYSSRLQNCTAYGNTGNGFTVCSNTAFWDSAIDCLAVSNGGYGFSSGGASGFFGLIDCATYNNTSGATRNLTNSEGAAALSGDPFTAAGSNFGLNATAGAGAACRAAGLPSAFPGLPSTISYPDIGAVQHQDTGGGGSGGGGRLSLSL